MYNPSYLLQCRRLYGKYLGIAIFEDAMLDDKVWSASPAQERFFNFRIDEEQKKEILASEEWNNLRFNSTPLEDNEAYADFAKALKNNSIIDIRPIPSWRDLMILTPMEENHG